MTTDSLGKPCFTAPKKMDGNNTDFRTPDQLYVALPRPDILLMFAHFPGDPAQIAYSEATYQVRDDPPSPAIS